jgi:hypothetical protein
MCDLALSVSGGMSPQRDIVSANAAVDATRVGDPVVNVSLEIAVVVSDPNVAP